MAERRDFAIATAYALGAITTVAVATAEGPRPPVVATALLSLVAVVAERRQITVAGRLSVSATYLPIVLALVIGGPLGGAIVSAVSMLAHFTTPYVRWFVWTCATTIAASTA